MIEITAKVTGYHPASGLHLVEGEKYPVAPEHLSKQVFEGDFEEPADPAKTTEKPADQQTPPGETNEGGAQ